MQIPDRFADGEDRGESECSFVTSKAGMNRIKSSFFRFSGSLFFPPNSFFLFGKMERRVVFFCFHDILFYKAKL